MDGAIAIWSEALEQGRSSATIHYNLGVAWYRKGELGMAIAHWRMARVLSPRNARVVHNLAVARSELEAVGDPLSAQPVPLQFATVTEWSVVGCLVLALSSLGLWLPMLKRRFGPWPFVGMAVLGALLCLVALASWRTLVVQPAAVVVRGPAVARLMKVADADPVATSPVGAELIVERVDNGFVLVRVGKEQRGWVPEGSVAIIGTHWADPGGEF